MKHIKALVLTGYGLNCDREIDFSLKLAGAESHRVHINDLIISNDFNAAVSLKDFQILVFGGGFSWADDHGAGVLMATKLKHHLGPQIEEFIASGKLILAICNGFQCLVNLGLIPAFEGDNHKRRIALTYNDSGNFIDTWVRLAINPASPCIFTRGINYLELPVRHGEGKVYGSLDDIKQLKDNNQIVMHYVDENNKKANGRWPQNPNGSLLDIAGICDSTGRIFGMMPHPEAFNHYTNHPDWTRIKEEKNRAGEKTFSREGDGIKIFRNAVDYIKNRVVD